MFRLVALTVVKVPPYRKMALRLAQSPDFSDLCPPYFCGGLPL